MSQYNRQLSTRKLSIPMHTGGCSSTFHATPSSAIVTLTRRVLLRLNHLLPSKHPTARPHPPRHRCKHAPTHPSLPPPTHPPITHSVCEVAEPEAEHDSRPRVDANQQQDSTTPQRLTPRRCPLEVLLPGVAGATKQEVRVYDAGIEGRIACQRSGPSCKSMAPCR